MPYVQRLAGAIVGLYVHPQPQPDGTDLAPEWLADDHPDVIAYCNPQPDIRAIAGGRLRETDHVEYRVWTPERTPSREWLAWREAVREVVRGNASAIPNEPTRYGDAPAPVAPLPPDPAPQDIAPPAADVSPAADVVGGAIDTYPGLFLQRDDEARLRADVITAITMCEQRRLQADGDVNRSADILQAIVDYHNTAGAGQTMTDDLRRRYDEAMRFQQREAQIRAHADQLRSAAIVADMPMLQAMIETHEDGWP